MGTSSMRGSLGGQHGKGGLWAALGLSPIQHDTEPQTTRLRHIPGLAADAGSHSSRHGLSHLSLLGRGTLKC